MSEIEFMDIFGDNLRDILIEQGYTQKEFARAIGVTEATVSRYINKERIPTVPIAINMMLELSVDVDDLFPMYDRIR